MCRRGCAGGGCVGGGVQDGGVVSASCARRGERRASKSDGRELASVKYRGVQRTIVIHTSVQSMDD